MTFENPYQAAEDFAEQVREALGCIFEQVHLKIPPATYRNPGSTHAFVFNRGTPQPLYWHPDRHPVDIPPLSLEITLHIQVDDLNAQLFQVSTSGYSYILYTREHGRDRELIAWQWDQRGVNSPVTYPHVHVAADHRLFPRGLGHFHIPTGRVLVEDVVEFCITQFDVRCQDDWQDVLNRNRKKHNERRTQR